MAVVAPQRSWIGAHWKAVLAIAVSVSVLAAIVVFSLIRTSDAAKLAISTAETNPSLALEMGQPLTVGWFISGNIEVTPASGHAELAIPMSGPKGNGTLYVEAHKKAGLWQLDLLQFGKNGSNDRLDLLTATPSKSLQQ